MDNKTKEPTKSPKIPSPKLAKSDMPVETSVDAAQPASELKYRTVFDNAGDTIIIHDLNGKILDVNKIACDRLGFTREELLRMTPMDFDSPEYAKLVPERILQIMANKHIIFETCHLSKDGTRIPTENSSRSIEYDGKRAILSICRDITEHKKADGLMHLQGEIAKNISEGIYLVSAKDLRIVYANPKMETMFGYDPGEMEGQHVSIINAPTQRDPVQTANDIEKALKETGVWRGEVFNIRKDRTTFWGYACVSMLNHPEHGKVYVSLQTDITERKLMDEALRDSEKRYHTLFEQSPDGIVIVDTEGKVIEFNETAHQQLGYSREEFSKFRVSDIDPVESSEEIRARIGKIREEGKAEFVVKHRTKDGEVRDVNVISRAIVLAGKPVMHAIWHDITERKRAEIKIMQSEKLIRNILDTVDEGFIAVDKDFCILLANKAYCSQVGLTSDEVIGKHCHEISHKSLRPCFEEGEDCAVRHAFETGEPYNTTHKHPDAKGDILYVETKAFPLKDSSGGVISVIETVNNITEKHLLEDERMKTQKLEAIGMLAGGIAHDFNNLLQGVFGYISMAKIAYDDKERSHTMLEQAENALNMSVNLTTQLLTFSKGGKPVKQKISLQSVIENSVRFALSGTSSEYRIKLDAALWQVEADEGQIGQVIQNIVINADQSMPMGGIIVTSAKNVQTPKKGIPQLSEEGKYVEISVQDNGIGISEKSLSKIFDPYFTTKAKGSGLGLATSYSIIKNHGGVIHVSSKMGTGTTFYVYLPAVEAVKVDLQTPEPSPFVRRGRILLMDDEEMIRDIAGEMIKALGHEVELAEHGEEAIEQYEAAIKNGNPFDIVILDLTIRGGMGGRETIERLLAVNSKIRAIVSSGFSDDSVVSDYDNYGFRASLTKPYKLQELRDTLNYLLSK